MSDGTDQGESAESAAVAAISAEYAVRNFPEEFAMNTESEGEIGPPPDYYNTMEFTNFCKKDSI